MLTVMALHVKELLLRSDSLYFRLIGLMLPNVKLKLA
jgi:hypothetical protein